MIDADRPPPGAGMGGAGDGEHGGTNHGQPARAGLQSVMGAGQILVGNGTHETEGLGDRLSLPDTSSV